MIGDNSSLGVNFKHMGPLVIGGNVMMGSDVMIMTSVHNTSRTDMPMCKQGHVQKKRVIIEDNVWIGARVIIMPGLTMSQGEIIGACAVVPSMLLLKACLHE